MSKIDKCPKCGEPLGTFSGTGGGMPKHVVDWVGVYCRSCSYRLGMGTVMRRLARAKPRKGK